MYTSIKTITPTEAIEWLDTKNFSNRPISEFTVKRYAQEMKAGRWKLNGESVIFGVSGRLIDGQHRLKACVLSNTSFESVVVQGAEDAVFDTIDDGKLRNLADVLSIRGEQNASRLACGLRFVWEYASGQFHGRKQSFQELSSKQLLEKLLDKHQGIRKSAKLYGLLANRNGGLLLPPSLAIGLHYLFSLVNEDRADGFFTSFQSGLNLTDGSPILLLRNRLVGSVREKGGRKTTREAMYAYTVYAWNAFMQDRTLRGFSFKPTEALPEIHGVSQELAAGLLE